MLTIRIISSNGFHIFEQQEMSMHKLTPTDIVLSWAGIMKIPGTVALFFSS